jgi:hypothetical protein
MGPSIQTNVSVIRCDNARKQALPRVKELSGLTVSGAVQRQIAPVSMVDKIQTVQPGTIVDKKRPSAARAMVKTRQAEYALKCQREHVTRQRPPNNLDGPRPPSKGRASRAALAAAVT